MAIVETISTPTIRYYVKRGKYETISRMNQLRRQLGKPEFTPEEQVVLRKESSRKLAEMAMTLHRQFPE